MQCARVHGGDAVSQPRSVPSLDALAADPTKAAMLSAEERVRTLLACSALLAALAAVPLPTATPAPTPETEENDRLLTVAEAAPLLGFARSNIYEMIRRGEFPAVRRGKYVRVRRSVLTEWVQRKENCMDVRHSTVLCLARERRRSSSNSSPAKAQANRTRGKAGRSLDYGEPVGERAGENHGTGGDVTPASRQRGET
jgi:excisionase family DNA binding protein